MPSVNTVALGTFCAATYTHHTFTPVMKKKKILKIINYNNSKDRGEKKKKKKKREKKRKKRERERERERKKKERKKNNHKNH